MCCGNSAGPRRVIEWEKPIPGLANVLAIPTVSDEDFVPQHVNTLRNRRSVFSNSLLISFLSIMLVFYLVIKVIFFSFTELKEGVAVFLLSFAIGFISASRR